MQECPDPTEYHVHQREVPPTSLARLSAVAVGLLISLAGASSVFAALVDCQASRPGAGSVLYLYFPTATDSDFPDDPGGWGVSTSPLEPFDVNDLDPAVGTTAQLRSAITQRVRTDYCEFDVRVVQTTSANGTTNPPPSDDRWQVIGIGSDSAGLFGIAQDFDDFDTDEMDYARVWAGSFEDSFGGAGGALNGTNSTLARWANAIAGTISHEGGHNYGPDHPDAGPVSSEDASEKHLMSSPSGEDRAQDRHFSNTSFEILARNLGLYEQTVSNWDFINPNSSTADGLRITVLVRPADGAPTKGSMYTGGLSPWGDVSISASGSETFKGDTYDRHVVTFTSPQSWNNGADGEIPAGEEFHVGVGLTTDYIVRNVELTAGGSPMDLRPRVVGYTTGGSFDPATGGFHVTFFNPEPDEGPLLLSDFVVRYLPRTVDIDQMVAGGSLTGFDGLPVEPWAVRGIDQETVTVADRADVTVGSLARKRAVDFIADPPAECGLIEPPPIGDAVPPNRMEYCRDGHILGLFPAARIYIEATLVDPEAKYFDRDLQQFVVGPLESRIFVQLSGVTPDLNGNGIDDAIDISTGTCEDENSNGVCDEAEPRRVAKDGHGFGLLVGGSIPVGDADLTLDSGFSAVVDYRYPIGPRFSLVPAIGYAGFSGSGAPDHGLWEASLSGRFFPLPPPRPRYFVGLGLGAYVPSISGSASGGGKLGFGIDVPLQGGPAPTLELELVVEHHWVFDSERPDFLRAAAGLVVRH